MATVSFICAVVMQVIGNDWVAEGRRLAAEFMKEVKQELPDHGSKTPAAR